MNALNAEWLKTVRPKEDGKSDKYSWLFYKYLKKHNCGIGLRIFKQPNGKFIIGVRDGETWLLGSWCISILQGRSQRFAISEGLCPEVHGSVDVTEWFAETYPKIGRCIFFPEHCAWLDHSDGQWEKIDANHRRCRWCGHEQSRKVEHVRKYYWVSA